ncbi:SPFH domain-containing protein, partial [Streptomyces sp. NPDC058579]|uniref:SPFH domain-containing protein n=1 Tax=Streptomyces sp. NPDC058579 TaxID=3346548 RepID=UPI00364EA88B
DAARADAARADAARADAARAENGRPGAGAVTGRHAPGAPGAPELRLRVEGAVGATPSAAQWVAPRPGAGRGPAGEAVAASARAATDTTPPPGDPRAVRGAAPDAPGAEPRTAATPATPTPKPSPLPTTHVRPISTSTPTPDPRRIVQGKVGVVALPVAAETRVRAESTVTVVPVGAEAQVLARPLVRRKNVIGAETTGSIPVHLLFREEPGTEARTEARTDARTDARAHARSGARTDGRSDADRGDDDGGPATVAMSPPAPPAPKATIPAPTRPQASRPAPTADPKLVEREGAVLPGWIGVVGGVFALAACAAVLWWTGAVPDELARMLRLPPQPYQGIHLGQWALLTLGVLATLFTLGGLGRGRVGYALVLTLFGEYRGTVRRTGLVWVSPLLLRRRVDVRLRHWRSEPLSSVDAKGTALDVVVLVVWRIRDTVRAALGVDGHEEYLREQVEAAMARVLSQLPADAFHEDAPTLRDAEAVGEALTRMLSAECAPVGIDVFSAQPTRIEYAPEIARAMQRRRIAAIDAKHRDSVLTSVVDAVDDVVHRLTTRGLVELDDYERKALVKDLTVAFYTGRTGPVEGA